jgi:outer membrane protein TolC
MTDLGTRFPTLRSTAVAIIFVVSVSLAGCAVGRRPVGPQYAKPSTDLGPFHNLSGVKAVKTELPSLQFDNWWTGFNDPMLVTVVQRALEQNLDLAAAFARMSQARAVAAAAGAQLLPTADFGVTATALRQSVESPLGSIASSLPGYRRNQREYAIGAAASWEIDLAGGLRRGRAAAVMTFRPPKPTRSGHELQSRRKQRTHTFKCGNFRRASLWRNSSSIPTSTF